MFLNGFFEIIFGFMMALDFYLRTSPLLLSVHLFIIVFSLRYNAIAIRDLGLAFATLSIFFLGPDKLSIDYKK